MFRVDVVDLDLDLVSKMAVVVEGLDVCLMFRYLTLRIVICILYICIFIICRKVMFILPN